MLQTSAFVALCDDNRQCLAALANVIESIGEQDYCRSLPACPSGVGSHVRHVLDHYDAFFDGLDSGHVDYDARARDAMTATDRSTALHRIRAARSRLARLAGGTGDRPLSVCMDCGDGGRSPSASSVARELQFLVSHTVHHDALIAVAVRSLGVDIERGFGVAPSTLKADVNPTTN